LLPCYTITGNSVRCDFSKDGYWLPTEAEWEYPAKGGRSSGGYKYAGGNDMEAVGRHGGNAGSVTHPMGGKQANEQGLYDMSGNGFEWCWDWHEAYGSTAQNDPKGPTSGSYHVLRGGSWAASGYCMRCGYRSHDGADAVGDGSFGFRVARRGG